MFVVSVTKSKIKKSIITASVVLIITLCFVFLMKYMGDFQSAQMNNINSHSASNEEEILTFISSYGWEVDKEPVEVRDVVIPEVFDDVYSNYNKIQLEQGFDLQKYSGRRVKRWTYIIRNYPDTTPEDDFIRINLLIKDEQVIGGDVCSVKLDGFMHGLYKQ